jgi:RNA polymerase sigma-70 factor, ECF subfamily
MNEDINRQLIDQCLRDDRTAQEQLYRLHADKMFSVCNYYAVDREEASDFLQDAYIKVFKKLHTYNFNGSLEGWIRKIVVNTALSHIRKKKKFIMSSMVVEDLPEMEEIEDVEIDLVPQVKVLEKVNDLPEKAALVLKLFAIEGYTHHEIAEIMEISVGTSKSQLNRARTLLKLAFKNER